MENPSSTPRVRKNAVQLIAANDGGRMPTPHTPATPTAEVLSDGSLVIRLTSPGAAAPDELRPLSQWAQAWGLELKGLEHAAARAGIPVVKIGRAKCARRSDVLAIADKLAEKSRAPRQPAPTYEALVRSAGGAR